MNHFPEKKKKRKERTKIQKDYLLTGNCQNGLHHYLKIIRNIL